MTETSTEAPILTRINITRDEYHALKVIALQENKTTQELLAELARARIANS